MKAQKYYTDAYIERIRWPLVFFASKNHLYSLLFSVPAAAIWLYFFLQSKAILELPLYALLGVLLWTLVEYLIHRYPFHWHPKNKFIRGVVYSFHMYHHQRPQDFKVLTSGLLPFLGWSVVITFVLSSIITNFSIVSGVMFGLVCTYMFYEWVHRTVHYVHFKNPVMKFLQGFHLSHHVNSNYNFGQISPIWDIVFGTYLPPSKWDEEKHEKHIIKGDTLYG